MRTRVLRALGLAATLAMLTAGGTLAASPNGQTVTVTDHAHGVFDDPRQPTPATAMPSWHPTAGPASRSRATSSAT